MRLKKSSICCLALILTMCIQIPAQSSNSSRAASTLDARVRAEIAPFKGKVMLFAKNLDTGVTYTLGADERVRTASTIKVAIMVEAFAQVAEGKVKWSDQVTLTKAKKVSGSGLLQDLSDGLQLSLRDAVNLMIMVSDNTATNLVLDVITADAVNARLDALGLKQTRSLRKVISGGESRAWQDPDLRRFGLGVSTPREMVQLLEKLERGEIISPAASKEMIELLKHQQLRDGIGRSLHDVPIASKPGSLDHLRSDVGIIYTPRGRIAMAITCEDIPEVDYSTDNPGLILISHLSLILMDGLGK